MMAPILLLYLTADGPPIGGLPKNRNEARGMVAYEFYRRDQGNGDKLIGILPERRKNPERITEESVMKWVKMVLGEFSENSIYFIQVEV
jgi:hypothetical protein